MEFDLDDSAGIFLEPIPRIINDYLRGYVSLVYLCLRVPLMFVQNAKKWRLVLR